MKSYTVTVDTDHGPVTGHYTPAERTYPYADAELDAETTDVEIRAALWREGIRAEQSTGRRQASEEYGDDDDE